MRNLPKFLLSAVFFVILFSLSGYSKIDVVTNDETSGAKSVAFPFVIYQDGNSKYYYATGWMGDYGDLNLNQNDRTEPVRGKSGMKFIYTARKMQNKGWVGIFWQNPMNNWGTIKGGFNLTGAKKLVFWARGQNGGETVEFKMGGLSGGAYSDTATATAGGVKLTKDWKQYSIDLSGLDLTRIVGGFCVILNSLATPNGCVFYVDDIYYTDEDVPSEK